MDRHIWNGRVVVSFSVEGGTRPSHRHIVATTRRSYLPLALGDSQARRLLSDCGRGEMADLWFELAGQPVNWHLPIGALVDRHLMSCGVGTPPAAEAVQSLPAAALDIRVRFDDFPATSVPRCANLEKDTETAFAHALKQASYVRTGSAASVGRLSPDEHARLWRCLKGDEGLATYQELADPLLHCGGADGPGGFPVRLVRAGVAQRQAVVATADRDRPLAELLADKCGLAAPEPAAEAGEAEAAAGAGSGGASGAWGVACQGLLLPASIPAGQLEALAHADGFVYLVAR